MTVIAPEAPEVVQPQVTLLHSRSNLVGRQELLGLPIPEATRTHVPIPHADVVAALVQSLGYRNIEVVKDEYALTPDYMRMFGIMTVNVEHSGVRLALGIRNSHDKSFSLAITVGFKVFVCDNLMFNGDFQAVLARKHTKHFDLADTIALGVERMQRGFAPMGRQIDAWREHSLTDSLARNVIYAAFIEDGMPIPKHLAKVVHEHYFAPAYPEFEPRTMRSLQNAFTSAFKELDPIPQIKATAKLAGFLDRFGN
jgi:Domain of unknown function (DUF932)